MNMRFIAFLITLALSSSLVAPTWLRAADNLEKAQSKEMATMLSEQPSHRLISKSKLPGEIKKLIRRNQKKYPALKDTIQGLVQDISDTTQDPCLAQKMSHYLYILALSPDTGTTRSFYDLNLDKSHRISRLKHQLRRLLTEGLKAAGLYSENAKTGSAYRNSGLPISSELDPQTIAAQALRLYFEMHLVAGKIESKIRDTYITSAIWNVLFGLLTVQGSLQAMSPSLSITDRALSTIPLLLGAIWVARGIFDLKTLRQHALTYTEPDTGKRVLFPGVRFYDRHHKIKSKAKNLQNEIASTVQISKNRATEIEIFRLLEEIAGKPIAEIFDDMVNLGEQQKASAKPCKVRIAELLTQSNEDEANRNEQAEIEAQAEAEAAASKKLVR